MALSAGVLLDTHSWIWLEAGTLRGTPETLKELREAASRDELFVVSFSLCEIANAVARKRLSLGRPLWDWFQRSLSRPGPRVVELSPEVAAKMLELPDTFHGDPGDRILAATAMLLKLTICTHDVALLRFSQQGLYRTLKVRETKVSHAP